MIGHKICSKIHVGESTSCAFWISQKQNPVPRITLVVVTRTVQNRFTVFRALFDVDYADAWREFLCALKYANATGFEPVERMPVR